MGESCDRPDGRKKAFVKLEKGVDALEVANKVSPPHDRRTSSCLALTAVPTTRMTCADWLHLNHLASRLFCSVGTGIVEAGPGLQSP